MIFSKNQFRVPFDFRNDDVLTSLENGTDAKFILDWEGNEEVELLGNVWAVQRFITAILKFSEPTLCWSEKSLHALKNTPGSAFLLGCAIQIDSAKHILIDGTSLTPSRRVALQQAVGSHQLEPNWFDSTDSLVFTENKLRGWNKDFYTGPALLRPRSEIERLLNPLIEAKIDGLPNEEMLNKWKDSLISVIYELFENTHIHARFNYDGFSIVPDLVRVVVVRLTKVSTGGNAKNFRTGKIVDCLEISILDSGIGFFGSKFKRPIAEKDDLKVEWLNLRQCLDKHIDDEPFQHTHRGVGLYEVLRALYFLKGAIQVRSGRTFGYRSFLPVDYQLQMEPSSAASRPGMPKGKLLDFHEPYRASPTLNNEVRGVVARTLVPLAWS
ncbi:MAG: hypothetical protein V4639_02700 [Pseudomonadota bacterium]